MGSLPRYKMMSMVYMFINMTFSGFAYSVIGYICTLQHVKETYRPLQSNNPYLDYVKFPRLKLHINDQLRTSCSILSSAAGFTHFLFK